MANERGRGKILKREYVSRELGEATKENEKTGGLTGWEEWKREEPVEKGKMGWRKANPPCWCSLRGIESKKGQAGGEGGFRWESVSLRRGSCHGLKRRKSWGGIHIKKLGLFKNKNRGPCLEVLTINPQQEKAVKNQKRTDHSRKKRQSTWKNKSR